MSNVTNETRFCGSTSVGDSDGLGNCDGIFCGFNLQSANASVDRVRTNDQPSSNVPMSTPVEPMVRRGAKRSALIVGQRFQQRIESWIRRQSDFGFRRKWTFVSDGPRTMRK